MADFIVGVITKVEADTYDNKEFRRVTLGDREEPLKVKQGRDGALKAKWGLLQEGVAIKFIMEEYTNPKGVKFPFVSDIETVEGALPPPVTPKLPAEAKAQLPQAKIEGAERGMWEKEVGENIRAGLIKNTGATSPYWHYYWLRMSQVLNVKAENKEE